MNGRDVTGEFFRTSRRDFDAKHQFNTSSHVVLAAGAWPMYRRRGVDSTSCGSTADAAFT